MNLTVFQKLVLFALAVLLLGKNDKLAALMWDVADGQHTDDQKESLLNDVLSSIRRKPKG